MARDRLQTMFPARVLAIFVAFALVASGAELKGTWSATSQAGNLAGSWTAQPDQSGGATGTWMLQDATGRILMQGGWVASKLRNPGMARGEPTYRAAPANTPGHGPAPLRSRRKPTSLKCWSPRCEQWFLGRGSLAHAPGRGPSGHPPDKRVRRRQSSPAR